MCRSRSSRPWPAPAWSSPPTNPPRRIELLAGGRGIVVPAGDVDAYAEALRTAVSMDAAERRTAGEAARRWIEVEHGPGRVAAELVDALSLRSPR